MFIEVPITKSMIKTAEEMGKDLGKLRNSVMNGERNTVAFLGEQIFLKGIGGEYKGLYDYDILYDGKRYEIKSKERYNPPQLGYDCTVFAYNTIQETDYYAFTSILKDYSKGWIVGYVLKEEFYKKAMFKPKGSLFENQLVAKGDAYQLLISKLTQFQLPGILTW